MVGDVGGIEVLNDAVGRYVEGRLDDACHLDVTDLPLLVHVHPPVVRPPSWRERARRVEAEVSCQNRSSTKPAGAVNERLVIRIARRSSMHVASIAVPP